MSCVCSNLIGVARSLLILTARKSPGTFSNSRCFVS
jgi:hypothetical protein